METSLTNILSGWEGFFAPYVKQSYPVVYFCCRTYLQCKSSISSLIFKILLRILRSLYLNFCMLSFTCMFFFLLTFPQFKKYSFKQITFDNVLDWLISHSYLVFGPKWSWSRLRHFCIAARASLSSTFKHIWGLTRYFMRATHHYSP